ncbi:RICIN domain-containing protein [Streptomyces sp. VB1]|uniref:RICIN domain-containing protein n=1 Tax=Streptomyces sp. VB1 TaxID=2986803 RepID=UPI002241F0EF|nr:RICIN domain-containing protein [Streptomyces sp. VB1]UZI31511.1 RICIN domain-containing protein [Streptomyces sp. VB1]
MPGAPGAPGDPGSALAPGGGERPGGTAASAAGAAPKAAARAENPAAGTPANTNADATTNASTGPDAANTGEVNEGRTNAPRDEPESAAEPAAAPAAAVSGTASTTSSVPTAELATVSTDGPTSGTAATATGTGGGGGASSQEGDEPPGSRPKKPMLAAAGIVGALLIAVPFLLAGQDDREPERTRTENAAGTVLDSERPPVPETYTSQSPAPSATPSKKEEKKEKKEKKPVGPVIHQQPVTPSPTPSPEKSKTEKKPEPKPKAKKLTPAEQLRQWANGRSGVQNTVIKNAATGQCVDVPGWGKGEVNSRINQDPCTASTADNQLWNLDIVDQDGGPQNAPLFLIRNSKGGLCLDLGYYEARPAGTKVAQFHCNATGDNQLWWLDPRGDGTNWIRNAVSNDLCLRPTGGASAGDDTALEIANCGFGDRWIV